MGRILYLRILWHFPASILWVQVLGCIRLSSRCLGKTNNAVATDRPKCYSPRPFSDPSISFGAMHSENLGRNIPTAIVYGLPMK